MASAAVVLLVGLLTAYPLGALAALVVRGPVGRPFVAAGAGLSLGAICLCAGLAPTFTVALLLTEFMLRIDGLSAALLVIIGVVGGAVAAYGFGCSAAYEGRYALRLPGASAFPTAATWTQRPQGGSLHLYLVYMTFALLVLPSVARWCR